MSTGILRFIVHVLDYWPGRLGDLLDGLGRGEVQLHWVAQVASHAGQSLAEDTGTSEAVSSLCLLDLPYFSFAISDSNIPQSLAGSTDCGRHPLRCNHL